MQLRSFCLCAALALSACGGGGGSVPAVPGSPNVLPQSASRATESVSAGSIYVAFAHRVDVYPKEASGHPSPNRSITGLPTIGAIAVDRFGYLYVAEANAWTVREFASTAHGNAQPVRTFVAKDPAPGGSSAQHATYAIQVRYDGGVALLGQRFPHPAQPDTLTIGVFDARYGGFDVVQNRAGFGESLGVDGSGNVLFTYRPSKGSSQFFVERFSPHPYGFNDDGPIGAFDSAGGVQGAQLAAAPNDTLELDILRCSENEGPALVCGLGPGVSEPILNMAFDAYLRLYVLSTGSNPSTQSKVETFPAAFQPGQGPTRSFNPALAAGDSRPSQLAVTQ